VAKKKASAKKSTIQEVREDINPQLCKTYNPEKHDWSHAWVAEPKFDGIRCNIVVSEQGIAKAYSRNGKPLWNLDKILAEIQTKPQLKNLVFDGEVYVKDWNLSMAIVKRSTKTHPDQDKIKFHVWDCITIGEWHQKYTRGKENKVGVSYVSNSLRQNRLLPLADCKNIEIVQGKIVNNAEELNTVYIEYLEKGYEGVLLKNPEGIYECGRRSPHWLKVKPWSDADLTVIGSYPGEGKHLGRIGGLVLQGEVTWMDNVHQVRTEVGTGFTDEERERFQGMADLGTLIGRIVEIKFQDITADGSCRFPVYHRLRLDKE
jgi:ATP-dependent DNA ligase